MTTLSNEVQIALNKLKLSVSAASLCDLKVLEDALRKEREAAVPYGYVHQHIYEDCGSAGLSNDHEAYGGGECESHIPLYRHPPAQPVAVPDEATWEDAPANCENVDWAQGWNACRAAMLKEAK